MGRGEWKDGRMLLKVIQKCRISPVGAARRRNENSNSGRKGEVFGLTCARPQRLLIGDVGGHCHKVPSDEIKAL